MPTTTIPLPGGQSAEMVAVDEMTGLQVEQVVQLLDLGDINIESLDGQAVLQMILRLTPQINRALTVAMTASWTLTGGEDEPLPISMETIGAQPMRVLRPLYAHAKGARGLVLESLGLGSLAADDPNSAGGS